MSQRGFVGDDAEVEPALREFREHRVHAGEEPRLDGQVERRRSPESGAADGELARGSASGKSEIDQARGAMADRWRAPRRRAAAASCCSRRSAFSAPTMSGAVSSSVPSRSNRIARSAARHGVRLAARARRPAEMREVIDAGIRRTGETPGSAGYSDTGEIVEFEPRRPSPARELGGADELQVFVGAPRQHARDVFGAENRDGECLRVCDSRSTRSTSPPGFTRAASAASAAAGSGTCSSISMQVTSIERAGRSRASASAAIAR